jgi:hypothetical protein
LSASNDKRINIEIETENQNVYTGGEKFIEVG